MRILQWDLSQSTDSSFRSLFVVHSKQRHFIPVKKQVVTGTHLVRLLWGLLKCILGNTGSVCNNILLIHCVSGICDHQSEGAGLCDTDVR